MINEPRKQYQGQINPVNITIQLWQTVELATTSGLNNTQYWHMHVETVENGTKSVCQDLFVTLLTRDNIETTDNTRRHAIQAQTVKLS